MITFRDVVRSLAAAHRAESAGTEDTMKDDKPTAPKKRRTRNKPSAIAVAQLVRMPLGELTRTAALLADEDEETARYLAEKLGEALAAGRRGPHEAEGTVG